MDYVLAGLPRVIDPNVIVGFETSDDAGVYKLTADCALVQTVDFFTPIVDDPFQFGAIAAANALSDVYAMGGKPITSLSILAWPGKGDLDDLKQILQGGAAKMMEAGCVILGGHSIAGDEPQFGYAVTGIVHPDRVLSNAGARVGDALVFTKRLGTGVIATALKRGIAQQNHVDASIASMLTLNCAACEAMLAGEAHSCTDVSGFGLIGHAREMAAASNVTLEIDCERLQYLPGALDYAREGAIPGGLKNNKDFAGPNVQIKGVIAPEVENLLYDPQTSGGLLIALPEAAAAAMEARYPQAYRIGRVIERGTHALRIRL